MRLLQDHAAREPKELRQHTETLPAPADGGAAPHQHASTPPADTHSLMNEAIRICNTLMHRFDVAVHLASAPGSSLVPETSLL